MRPPDLPTPDSRKDRATPGRAASVFHGLIALYATTLLALYWYGLLVLGNGRFVRFGPIGYGRDILVIGSFLLTPAAVFSGLRVLQLRGGGRDPRSSIPGLANAFAILLLSLSLVVAVTQVPWRAVFQSDWTSLGEFSRPVPSKVYVQPDFPRLFDDTDYYVGILQDLNGGSVPMTDFRCKPLVVNFWATWCSPCIQEMPDFQSLYNELGDVVEFAFVSTEDPETVRRFRDSSGLTVPFYTVPEVPEPSTLR